MICVGTLYRERSAYFVMLVGQPQQHKQQQRRPVLRYNIGSHIVLLAVSERPERSSRPQCTPRTRVTRGSAARLGDGVSGKLYSSTMLL